MGQQGCETKRSGDKRTCAEYARDMEAMHAASKSSRIRNSEEERFNILLSQTATGKELLSVAEAEGDFDVLKILIKHPKLTAETLRHLAYKLKYQEGGAESTYKNNERLAKMAKKAEKDRDTILLMKQIAQSPKNSQKSLDYIAEHYSNATIIVAVINNPKTSPKTLDRIARKNDSSYIKSKTLDRIDILPSTLDFLASKGNADYVLSEVAKHPRVQPKTLAKLAKISSWKTQYQVASNPKTKTETLLWILNNGHSDQITISEVMLHHRNATMRVLKAIAENAKNLGAKKEQREHLANIANNQAARLEQHQKEIAQLKRSKGVRITGTGE